MAENIDIEIVDDIVDDLEINTQGYQGPPEATGPEDLDGAQDDLED